MPLYQRPRAAPAYRQDGAYALLVFLHAQTIRQAALDQPAPDPVEAARCLAEAKAALAGLECYQRHPFRRAAPDVPVVWRRGSVRLLDFGGSGPAVLTIPSMVNGAQIMDLAPDLSPLRWMAGQGFRLFQVDWGSPGPAERGFALGDYLEQRLIPALDVVRRLTGVRPHVVGYCMGGPLTLALAQRAAEKIDRLVTLGAPWDFSAFPEHSAMRERRAEVVQALATMEMMFGVIPPQMTQSFFALRDLSSGVAKFKRFAASDPASLEAQRFVAVEDWLNEGVPLSPSVGRECFLEWITDDAPRNGRWMPGGLAFASGAVTRPTLVVSAQRDTVVRRAASEPLAEALPKATLLKADVGHIGMVVGARAIESVWTPLAGFLRS